MFAAAALGRLGIWLAVQVSEKRRTIARKQIASNLETLKLCFHLV
jgi:hypothetical protein